MTDPSENGEFCFPRILGEQNSLFPSGQDIKCLVITGTQYKSTFSL